MISNKRGHYTRADVRELAPSSVAPLTVSFELDAAEHRRVHLKYLFTRPAVVAILVFIIFPRLFALVRSGLSIQDWGVLFGALGVLAFVAYRTGIASFNRLTEDQRHIRYGFTEAHFVVRDRSSSAEVPWSGMAAYQEWGDVFLIFAARGTAHVLPKRVLGEPGQLDAVRAWLRARLKKRSKRGWAWLIVTWVVLVLMFWAIYQIIAVEHSPR